MLRDFIGAPGRGERSDGCSPVNSEAARMRSRRKDSTYYTRLWTVARTFRVDLPRKQWCDLWHHHFDLRGVGNRSFRDRRIHLKALFQAFRRAREELALEEMPYQLFLNISRTDSSADALYVHTPNPNKTSFPLSFDSCEPLKRLPPLLRGVCNLDQFLIGRDKEGKDVWYVVRTKPLS